MSFINAALRYGAGAVRRFIHLTAVCTISVILHVGSSDLAPIDLQIALDIVVLAENINGTVSKVIVSGLIPSYDCLERKIIL